ncbi:MAG: class I SAM-dependent methyltransferase [Candidatus Latescibacterota bacterium]|nr:MAG: class I SAM-dependent methyltransferase [Candidatus Latescibacterota bacterium]
MQSEEPKESLAEIVRRYEEKYRKGYGMGATAGHRMTMQEARLFRDRGVKTILDVGCGRGLIINELLVWDFDVKGTEIVPYLFDIDLRGLPVVEIPVQKLAKEFDPGSFDLVLMIDLLDHLRTDHEIFEAMETARFLANKGFLLTVNGYSSMKTFHFCAEEWLDKVRYHFPAAMLRKDRSGAILVQAWRADEDITFSR